MSPIHITKDGRTILGGADYTKFRADLWTFQCGCCSACHRVTSLETALQYDGSFHVHHKGGRGMGGGKRDDTSASCVGLCGSCHRKEHGQ